MSRCPHRAEDEYKKIYTVSSIARIMLNLRGASQHKVCVCVGKMKCESYIDEITEERQNLLLCC